MLHKSRQKQSCRVPHHCVHSLKVAVVRAIFSVERSHFDLSHVHLRNYKVLVSLQSLQVDPLGQSYDRSWEELVLGTMVGRGTSRGSVMPRGCPPQGVGQSKLKGRGRSRIGRSTWTVRSRAVESAVKTLSVRTTTTASSSPVSSLSRMGTEQVSLTADDITNALKFDCGHGRSISDICQQMSPSVAQSTRWVLRLTCTVLRFERSNDEEHIPLTWNN